MTTSQQAPRTEATETAWPKGVIARYLTVAGATYDLRYFGNRPAVDNWDGACTGCDSRVYGPTSERLARDTAQAHAAKCRALPRPTT